MQKVRRADVHRLDRGIIQNLAIIGGRFRHAEFVGKLLGLIDLRLADRLDVDKSEPANAFQMDPAHEAGAENRRFDSLHGSSSENEGLIYRSFPALAIQTA